MDPNQIAWRDKLAGLTRDQLIEKKADLDIALGRLRNQLNEAKARGAADGVYMPILEFRALNDKIKTMARWSQRYQMRLKELSDESKEKRIADAENSRKNFNEYFRKAAFELLPKDLFDQVLNAASVMFVEADDKTRSLR